MVVAPPDDCVEVVGVVLGAVVVVVDAVGVVPALVVVTAVVAGLGDPLEIGGVVSIAPLFWLLSEPHAPSTSAQTNPSGSARTPRPRNIGRMLARQPVAPLARLRYARVPGAANG